MLPMKQHIYTTINIIILTLRFTASAWHGGKEILGHMIRNRSASDEIDL